MQKLVTALLIGASALTAAAQTAPAFNSTCNEQTNGGDKHSYCETRDLTLSAPSTGALLVDAQRNGGITVRSWSGTDVRVRARVQSWADDDATAKANVDNIKISTVNDKLLANSAANENSWSVSYELLVPEKVALDLRTHNGGISLDGVRGAVKFEAENGGVNIVGDGGDVRGRTKNGGISITLNGKKWEGKGLDVSTTNGGISWKIPADYTAKIYSSTTRGRISNDFTSIKDKPRLDNEVALAMGKGGAPIKAVTTNGGISIRRLQ
jgi:hypothetical protein